MNYLPRALPYLVLLGFFLGSACSREQVTEAQEHRDAAKVLLCWNKLLLELDRYTEGYRAPVSARMFAYTYIAVWESCLPAMPGNRSLADRLPGLQLPKWENKGQFALPVALNAAFERSIRHFFPHQPIQVDRQFKNTQKDMAELVEDNYAPDAFLASRKFGEAVADAVYAWSATDRAGHRAFLFNFDQHYVAPQGEGLWTPTTMPALLPNWGQVRTFAIVPDSITTTPPLPFSNEEGSPFFAQAYEVYQISQPLSEENRWIAEFWSDDFAGVTFCAVSRWISIANQFVEQQRPSFPETAHLYLALGLALHDVTVKVWRDKYRFNLERPQAYISRNIYPNWKPLHDSAPFPGYPSGHAAFASAAATVFAELFGDKTTLTDVSHKGRKEFNGEPRTFHSFSEMARENAFSRLAMGVHFRMDCEEGLRLGQIVGKEVVAFCGGRTSLAQ